MRRADTAPVEGERLAEVSAAGEGGYSSRPRLGDVGVCGVGSARTGNEKRSVRRYMEFSMDERIRAACSSRLCSE